jgi:sec-independent protein translocase protein TatB
MFGLGFGEIVVIAILALLVFGPDKLPELLGTLGKWVRYARGATTELRRTIETETRKILPPDLNLPRFGDMVEELTRPDPPKPKKPAGGAAPADGAPPAGADPDGPVNYGYGDAPVSGARGDASGGPDEFDEELDPVAAPPVAADAEAGRRARVDAIARALDTKDRDRT